MNNKKKYILGAIAVILAMAVGISAGLFFFQYYDDKNQINPEDLETGTQNKDDIIYVDGKEYVYNTSLKHFLFLGVDTRGEISLAETPGKGGQADAIMLFTLDEEQEKVSLLQISRNAMTDVDIYKWNGDYYTSVTAQIALQYAYGNGKDTSCWAMKRTVSDLLYELPIDGYIAMNVDGIATINDAVGGVSITIPEDYTDINPAFVKGETIVLDGKQAEQYVRYRDINILGSNETRMVRQTHYIPALIRAMKNRVADSSVSYETLLSLASPYVVTDLSGDQMKKLAEYELQTEEISYIPGETVAGEEHDEFHVNDSEMRNLILKLFYKQKQSDK